MRRTSPAFSRIPIPSSAPTASRVSGRTIPGIPPPLSGVLEKYVKQEYLLSLQQAIHKMTGMPAKKIGLKDRGLIAENKKADIVVMDVAKLHDNADYVGLQRPRRRH